MKYKGNLNNLYFTADLHFFHEKIIQYCDRPFKNAKEMNNILVKNWNSVIAKSDTVVVVGDIAIGKQNNIPRIIDSLNGRKILVLGNHDEYSPWSYIKMGFESVHTHLEIVNNDDDWTTYVAHDPAGYDVLSSREDDPFLICGHVHNLFKSYKGCVNCGVDIWNYEPIGYWCLVDEYNDSINRQFFTEEDE